MSAQCTATSKRSGQQCRRVPAPGASVCATHGGKAPQVKKAAEQRQAKAEVLVIAQRMAARAGVNVDPIEHLLDSLHHAAALVLVWETMVAAIDEKAAEETDEAGYLRGELGYDEVESEKGFTDLIVRPRDRLMAVNSKGEARVHPYMEELQRAIERRAKFAKMCIDADIAESQLRMLEQQVEMVQKAFEATLDKLGLDPGQRQEARREYGRHLRLVA